VDTSRPSPARLYDYYLGGKDFYDADRTAAEQLVAAVPELPGTARINRTYHQRAVTLIAGRGVSQFLDIGCGLPTNNNTHSIAQRIAPHAHVVYADHDPVVLAHARSLLADDGSTTVVQADIRRPAELLAAAADTGLLDFSRPIGLTATAVLHFVSDDDDPAGIVGELAAGLAPGSVVSLSHITADGIASDKVRAFLQIYANASENLYFRTESEFGVFFERAGLDIVAPAAGAHPRPVHFSDWNPPELAELPEPIRRHLPSPVADAHASRLGYCAAGLVR
jgi:SAM-dependent methyltransferase